VENVTQFKTAEIFGERRYCSQKKNLENQV